VYPPFCNPSYSIECVSKVLCPPTSQWRENIQIAIDCDAASIVTDVLKLHPGNEDVLDRCASCLKYLAYDATTAEQIADNGGISAVLASIDANPDLPAESVAGGLNMIEVRSAKREARARIAKHMREEVHELTLLTLRVTQAIMGNQKAFAKVVTQDLVDKIMSILLKYVNNPTIALSCMKVLEKVSPLVCGRLSQTFVAAFPKRLWHFPNSISLSSRLCRSPRPKKA